MTEKKNEKVSPDNSVSQNREIKFRGLIKGQHFKGFVYGYYYYSKKFDEHQILDEDGNIHVIDKQTLGQYTGFKDKNGVDIYEGDILIDKTKTGIDLIPRVIKWVSCNVTNGWNAPYVYQHWAHGYSSVKINLVYDKHEIIGNKHQNPELLSE